ncbi:MAG: hypothetical protein RL685_7746, partial [Pseudomonadota bacterium]
MAAGAADSTAAAVTDTLLTQVPLLPRS